MQEGGPNKPRLFHARIELRALAVKMEDCGKTFWANRLNDIIDRHWEEKQPRNELGRYDHNPRL